MRRNSLLRRVLIGLFGVTALTLLATLGLLWLQFKGATGVVTDRNLPLKLETIQQHLALDSRGRPIETLPAALKEEFHENYFFTVSDQNGIAYLSVPPGEGHAYHPFEAEHTDRPQYFEHRYTESAETYLGVTHHIMIDGQSFWLQIVEEVPYWKTLAYNSIELFVEGMGVLVMLHLIVVTLLCYAIVKASLAPVERAAEQALQIAPGKRGIRITEKNLPDEVIPLAEAINSALERLEKALAAQKRFTADAAHELLTPIAVLKADVDMIEDASIAGSLSEEVEAMADIVTQLLELSELESDEENYNQMCDLRQIAGDVLIKLAPLAIQKGIDPEMTGTGDPVLIRGSSKALFTAISNLVKNVINHATGATRLELSVQHDGRISVIDDGPGVPKEMRERIFERFHRLPDATGGGKGLGLAIVARIIDDHNGRVYVTDGPGGKGAAFVIEVPCQPGADGIEALSSG